ncbi:HNH endonuclease [Micromonospora sp. NPDC005257]|uniref:HNH endonuclease n=1 Tax=Micromonospora sp. NPDC005257 TaxID=3364230 RepID=UPI00368B3A0D
MSWRDIPCKEWTGKTEHGYGVCKVQGQRWRVTRLEWTRQSGPIPDGLEVCHHCDNPACYEVRHLWLGTHACNMADMAAKGRAARGLGERHGMSRLTEHQVQEIRARYATGGVTHRQLAAEYVVSKATIGLVTRRVNWKTVPLDR